jgi:hypothetical protein
MPHDRLPGLPKQRGTGSPRAKIRLQKTRPLQNPSKMSFSTLNPPNFSSDLLRRLKLIVKDPSILLFLDVPLSVYYYFVESVFFVLWIWSSTPRCSFLSFTYSVTIRLQNLLSYIELPAARNLIGNN